MDQQLTKQKIKELRAMVTEGDRVAIVLQDDPDPDAMSSAMALRTLLGRNKQTTPFFAFKPVTRPENRTMTHLLEIEIAPATAEELRAFDKIAMVDVQPPYFGDRLARADIVIDHHSSYEGGAAPFQDIRTRYGATATIMTEYLIVDEQKISERLATALLYGVKSDTLMLQRRATDDDVRAFVHLYPIANYNLLRQMDRPQMPVSFARILARAMKRLDVKEGLIALNLGRVERDDLIVQMADFCLQFEGADWVAVAGKLGHDIVISVRNNGIIGQGSAGEAVKQLFNSIGSAGGHRELAKAVIPERAWRKHQGSTRDTAVEARIRELFAAAIKGAAPAEEARAAAATAGA